MLKTINRICYALCIVCIIAGVLLGLLMIWGDRHDRDQWKYLATVSVLFFASMLTLSVNRFMDKGNV